MKPEPGTNIEMDVRTKKSPRGKEKKLSSGTAAAIAQPYFFNREISWLDFNARVLALAANAAIPLLERVKFLSIFSSNLDEFFMVRVAGLKEQLRVARAGEPRTSGESADDQLTAISKKIRELLADQSRLWTETLQPALQQQGIEVVRMKGLSAPEKKFLKQYFQKQVFPVLTPMAVDMAHPFPHLSNRGLFLCVVLRNESEPETNLNAFVEVPQILPRFVPLKNSRNRARFILLNDVIAMHLNLLFSGVEVLDSYTVRVTRDSDLELDDEDAEDLLKSIEAELRERQWGNVVRLEISNRAPEPLVKFLQEALEIERRDIYPINGPLNYADFFALSRLPRFESLKYSPFAPHVPAVWRNAPSVFSLIQQQDVLVHHPYESFSTVGDFLESAATDPDVLALKMTLYRTATDSPIMRSLIKAASNGKQVVVLVELKARFDEANNIQWAQRLEREGVHVVYGIVGLKTHCKACLVVRREGKTLRRYCHVSTGNYNHNTAALYTDLGLFTTDAEISEDITNLFNMLTGFGHQTQWNCIVPAPHHMDDKLLRLIRRETQTAKKGKPARITCKMNSLVHPPLIMALYEANQAGVQIDLIVRGICCLRPGIPGMSENIRVYSIIGRFLEHSRIFVFGEDHPEIYLSSADWMQRNFFSRIEIMVPVKEPSLRERILGDILKSALLDTTNGWELKSDGSWKHRTPGSSQPFDSQNHFIQETTREVPNALSRV